MTGDVFRQRDVDNIKFQADAGFRNITPEKEMTGKELKDTIAGEFSKAAEEMKDATHEEVKEKTCLTDAEKEIIKHEQNWSDEIIDHIDSMEQYAIYKDADLHEMEIDGRKCLVKNIDMDYVDPKTGMTNRERMKLGRAPIDSKTGEKIELHHMGQSYDSPFAELCENSEHGDGNHFVLHPNGEGSWRNNPKLDNRYKNIEKPNHWTTRATEV